MKLFFAFFIVMFLAFSGYHLSFRKIKLPLFARRFYLTGTEFLFLGLMLGPQFLNLLDEVTCQGLAPLTALLLGWIGLLFGFQFEIAKLRRLPMEYMGAAILEGGVTFGVVFCGVVFALPHIMSLKEIITNPFLIMIGLGFGAVAVCAAQTSLVLLAPDLISIRSKTIQLLSAIATFDGLMAMVLFGIMYVCSSIFTTETAEKTVLFHGPFFGLFACVCLFVLYRLMMVRRLEESELILIVIGMAIFSSGTAALLGFSPLITNFILGIGLVNFSREKERIFQLLMKVEKPVYLILLVLLGVGWRLNTPWVFFLAGGLCVLRLMGKGLGGMLLTRLLPYPLKNKRYIGLGLIDSGGLPLAVLFDFQQRFPNTITPYVISVGLLMVLYNDFLSPHIFSFLFKSNRL